MKTNAVLAVIVCVLALQSLRAAAASEDPSLVAARKAIGAGNARYLATLEKGDAAAFAALYMKDAARMSVCGTPIVRGRTTIEARTLKSFRGSKITGGTIHTTGVSLFPGEAYETGTYSFSFTTKGKAQTATGKYFVVWARQSDGSYLIKADVDYPSDCSG